MFPALDSSSIPVNRAGVILDSVKANNHLAVNDNHRGSQIDAWKGDNSATSKASSAARPGSEMKRRRGDWCWGQPIRTEGIP